MQKTARFKISLALLACGILVACASSQEEKKGKQIGMPNPASAYCISQKGKLVLRQDAQGNEVGYCTLKNGQVVEEWDFFRQSQKELAH
ncbi:DUF333 domain-containing protein [Acetobacteraceae bacterium]|nr:DUF333 domain-containing protein [Acetobacteraceae bacterium]